MYGNLSITTATSEINETVESMSRFLTTNRNIELLEPYEGKLSRTVLRGEGGSNALDLPDNTRISEYSPFQSINKPSIFIVSMQSGIYTYCHLSSIISSIQETVYIAVLICTCQ